ncbi:MAG: DUF3261 domain-containing protein, partial [Gammaproteobacteria bacterium]
GASARMNTKVVTLAFIALCVAGCASLPPPNCVAFSRGQFCLLPPAMLPALDGVRMVTIEHDGKKQMFIGQLHIDAQAIRLAGSSLFGPSLFTVSYDGHALKSEPAGGPQRADLLIAMLELVMADQRDLQTAMQDLTLTQTVAANGMRVRELFQRDRLVAHIEISAGPLTQASIRFNIPPAHVSVWMQPLANQTSLQP